ncbi:hypothetical protein Tco_0806392 [Tanacetum coccineum]
MRRWKNGPHAGTLACVRWNKEKLKKSPGLLFNFVIESVFPDINTAHRYAVSSLMDTAYWLSEQGAVTKLLEPIPKPHQVQQNDSNVISVVSNVEQCGGTVEQNTAIVEETGALYDTLYNNLAIEVEKVNSVNRDMKETNVELTTELARYKDQEKCFEINQEKYDKLERCYQKSVYQEQCLTKKINALHLSSAKTITTLNEEIANLNNQLSKEKSIVSSLQEEKKKLKSDFKIREDELLDIFQAQQKQQSLYNGKVLLEKHDPPAVYDSEETLQLAQESRLKMKQLNKEIKPENYAKINHLLGVFVSQKAKSREELYFSNISKTASVSKSISIPNEEFSDDTTPSVARKFLNEEALNLVRDFNSLAKEAVISAKHKALEFEIKHLLRAVVSQDILSIMQNNPIVDISNLQTELDPQLGDLKGKSKDTPCVSDTFDPLSQKLEDENVELEFQVPLKVVESNDLSNPVTSNSAPSSRESIVVNNERVIAPVIFRINPFKASKVDNFVPNKHVKASIRTKPITVSQPHVITKKDVNSNTNGFSPKNVDSTTRTKRPQLRNNPKNDKVPSRKEMSGHKQIIWIVSDKRKEGAQSTVRTKVLLVVKVLLLCSKGKIIMARIWRSIEEVIMKKIEYCLFDVVVEFHREMITSQLQGKLRLYDEVRARTLFVLSSSNRGRLLGIIDLMRQKNKRMKQEGLNRQIGKLQDSHGALDLGSTRHCSRYCSKVLLLFESTAHYAQSTARCESTAVMFEGTASFIREGKIIMARIWRFIEEVIMKKIEYCLFDVVVEFHREMITSQLQGKLRLYDEVRARTLFVLSSSNRGRLLGIIDLMRQKNKRMKQEGLNRQIGILQKMEFDCKLMIGKLQDVT